MANHSGNWLPTRRWSRYLRCRSNGVSLKDLLVQPLEEAKRNGLMLPDARTCGATDEVRTVLAGWDGQPVLVVRQNKGELLGILTICCELISRRSPGEWVRGWPDCKVEKCRPASSHRLVLRLLGITSRQQQSQCKCRFSLLTLIRRRPARLPRRIHPHHQRKAEGRRKNAESGGRSPLMR